jgi:hypothetical protein
MIGVVDPVAYALALDALTHPGPADASRIPTSVCSQAVMPGVDLTSPKVLRLLAALPTLMSVPVGALGKTTSGAPEYTADPPLACYATASCSGGAAPTLVVRARGAGRARSVPAGRKLRLRVEVLTKAGDALMPVPAVSVSLAGRSAMTAADGTATLNVGPLRRGRHALTAALAGCNPGTLAIVARRARTGRRSR